jgi:outer membrane protein TolC
MLALAAAVVLAGCQRKLFIDKDSFEQAHQLSLRLNSPTDLEQNPSYALQPGVHTPPEPPTITNPDRPIRQLKLQEAIALALESGNVGSQNQNFPGVPIDSLVSFSGRTVFGADNIRVFSLDPAITGADIEASLSKFDAKYVSSLTWNKRDDAIANILGNFQNGDQWNWTTGIYKPLPTGGVTGITWTTDYNMLSAPPAGVLNPTWRPRLAFQIEQPLLRDYGVEINQLNFSHPGSVSINQFRPQGARVEGVLITRLRFEQSQTEFERIVNHMLLNVEFAYWNLYAAYGALFARDQALVEAADLWKAIKARVDIDDNGAANEARTRAQLEAFRAQRYAALGQVLESERQLRSLIGLSDDGTRLVPSDSPTDAGFRPDWTTAVQETLDKRPELLLARQDLKFRQFDIMVQKNQLKPDLRAFASYDINGLGMRLDGPATVPGPFGPQPNNALASFTSNQFNTWQFGLRYDVPIGFRDAHSSVRVARLNLQRSYVQLRDSERKALLLLRTQYSRLDEYQKTLQSQRAQYEAAHAQYQLLQKRRDTQLQLAGFLEQLLNAQRTRSEALAAQFRAMADYNNTLAGWQFAKGTIMEYDNVNVAEGPLPEGAALRAADHVRERAAGLVLRRRSESEFIPGSYNIDAGPDLGIPAANNPPPNLKDVLNDLTKPLAPRTPPVKPASGSSYAPR